MAKYKSDFLNTLDERGFIHQCSDFAGLDALAAKGEAIGYIGFDCTAPSFHVGNMIVLMMLHWLQKTRQQADRAHGRRHHAGRRPLRQGRDAQDSAHRADRGQQGQHAARLRQADGVRLRPHRRHHARQRRVADQAQLHRDAARHRPPLLGQPHAGARLRQEPARARPGDELHRVQLPGAAGLRLHRAGAGARAATCRWAPPTSGATSSPASTSAGAWARTSSTR